jgi:hypothetical protein
MKATNLEEIKDAMFEVDLTTGSPLQAKAALARGLPESARRMFRRCLNEQSLVVDPEVIKPRGRPLDFVR